MIKTGELRKKYPRFFYESSSWNLKRGDLHISFLFHIPPDITFYPKVLIKNIPKKALERIGEPALNNLVFHLGLVEMISYWKATCSPEIVMEAGYLNKDQIRWWKDLILKGMGEYFYKNKIDFTHPNFLTITNTAKLSAKLSRTKFVNLFRLSSKRRIMVPVGGGKDAVVTLELLKRGKQRIIPFLLNPKKEQKKILKVAGLKNPAVVTRTIDPKLLDLNRKGYLNGHTPFSAYLAFLSVLCAALFDTKYIAFSNERSANEGNVKYLGHIINHQYSKSYEFEKKFREYTKKYLAKGVEYFSFLRPLYEFQIAKIFARYPKYFPTFLSCNVAHKTFSGREKPTQEWCRKCPKCLFVFLALYPFAPQQTIGIFKKDLLKDKTLRPLLMKLTGKRSFKPFECVGTVKESRAALSLCLGEIKDHKTLHAWNTKHFLPPQFSKLLKRELEKSIRG